MATISDKELAELRRTAAAYERRREQQRKDQAERTKRRREAGYQRITVEVRADTYAQHRANGLVPVGLMWVPIAERHSLVPMNEKNGVYNPQTKKWDLEDA